MLLLGLGLCVLAINENQLSWWLNPDQTAMKSLTHNEAEWVSLIMKSIVPPTPIGTGNDNPWPWLGKNNAVSNFAAEVDRGYVMCIRCKMTIPESLSQKLVLVNGRVCTKAQMHVATACTWACLHIGLCSIYATCKK